MDKREKIKLRREKSHKVKNKNVGPDPYAVYGV